MAFEEYDDYEQEQLVKQWLKDNALTIVAGIGLGLAGIIGYNYWQSSQTEEKYQLSEEFNRIKDVLDLNELDEADQMIQTLKNNSGQTYFSVQASMLLAKKHVENGDVPQAIGQYRAILEASPDVAIQHLARIRLARLLASQGEYQEALSQLDQIGDLNFKTMVLEIKGDVYLAQGQTKQAHDTYQLALNEGDGYSGRNIIEMKLADSQVAE